MLVCVLAAFCFGSAHTAESPPVALTSQGLADILLPETRAWRSIDSFPHPSLSELDDLLDSMIAKLPPDLANDASCSVTERLMRTPGFIAGLHQGDIFGPSDHDFVYVGENPCGEGHITIAWRHVHDLSRMISLTIRARMLRVDEASGEHFSEVEAGCCGEVTDHYRISDLSEVHQRSVGVFKGLAIPAGSRPARGEIDFGMDLRVQLYMSPADAAHPETAAKDENGDVMSFTVHGSGEVLMIYRDPAGKLWNLAEIGGKFANAGWVSGQASRESGGGAR